VADEHDGYTGPATLTVDGRDLPVHAILDARHEPHDGRMHWFGRVRADGDTDLAAALGASAQVELSTGTGSAPARVGEVDPWGRYRVTGVGPPPYRMGDPELDD
jgi:glucose/arabinose dehydrogenase